MDDICAELIYLSGTKPIWVKLLGRAMVEEHERLRDDGPPKKKSSLSVRPSLLQNPDSKREKGSVYHSSGFGGLVGDFLCWLTEEKGERKSIGHGRASKRISVADISPAPESEPMSGIDSSGLSGNEGGDSKKAKKFCKEEIKKRVEGSD